MHPDFSNAWRQHNVESLCAWDQRGHNRGMQFDAMRQLFRATSERGLPGQAHRRLSCRDGCVETRSRQKTGLVQKSFATTEMGRIDQLKKHRRAPAFDTRCATTA